MTQSDKPPSVTQSGKPPSVTQSDKSPSVTQSDKPPWPPLYRDHDPPPFLTICVPTTADETFPWLSQRAPPPSLSLFLSPRPRMHLQRLYYEMTVARGGWFPGTRTCSGPIASGSSDARKKLISSTWKHAARCPSRGAWAEISGGRRRCGGVVYRQCAGGDSAGHPRTRTGK